MTAPEDITPEEIEAIQARCEAATPGPWHEDDGFIHSRPRSDASRAYIDRLMRDHEFRAQETDEQINRPYTLVAQVWQDSPNFDADVEFLKNALADTFRLLAALRRRDAVIKGQTAMVLKMGADRNETDVALGAAKALLARAEIMLRSAANDPQCRLFEYRGRFAALLAEIEAEHGKP